MDLRTAREVSIDLYDRKVISIDAKQGDRFSRYILFSCCDGGRRYEIKDTYRVYVRCLKPDGFAVFNPCETIEGKVLVELTEQMLAAAGHCKAELMVTECVEDPGKTVASYEEAVSDKTIAILSTTEFGINVLPQACPDCVIESTNEFRALNDVLDRVNEEYEHVITESKQHAEAAGRSAEAAETAKGAAEAARDEAARSAASIGESAKTASSQAEETRKSAQAAEESKQAADASAQSADESRQAAESAKAEAEEARKAAGASEEAAGDYSETAKSWAVGGTGTRPPDEDTDNAKYYAQDAAASRNLAETARGDAQSALAAAEAAQDAAANARQAAEEAQGKATQAAQSAQDSAGNAGGSAAAAETASRQAQDSQKEAEAARTAAEEASGKAEAAQAGAQAAKDTAEAMAAQAAADRSAIENMSADADTLGPGMEASVEKQVMDGHVNLHFSIPQGDPGNDATINGKNAISLKGGGIVSVTEAESTVTISATANKHWDVVVQAGDWTAAEGESWAGMTAAFKAAKACEGMTEGTDIAGIQFVSGDRQSAAAWGYLQPGTSSVTLFSDEKPAGDFTLRLTEVR